jgi:HK97 gp10 family phage protein
LHDYTVNVLEAAESKAMSCLDQAADVVMQAARPLCAVKTGDMLKSLTKQFEGKLAVHVGYTAPYAYWVETGTRPHTIQVKTKKVLYSHDTKTFFGRKVSHPGAKAHPSLVPALESSKSRIRSIFNASS